MYRVRVKHGTEGAFQKLANETLITALGAPHPGEEFPATMNDIVEVIIDEVNA
ncbi:MAG TPA: hypothetical protein VLF71_04620 [Candidatus Saccharimonadales bacterium]|nr:hypothetical protein [Candidatus Saccharimonadales bacterium]